MRMGAANRWIRYILAAGCMVMASSLHAQQAVTLVDTVDQHIFSYQEIDVLEDPSGQLTFQDIQSPSVASRFTANTGFYPRNKNLGSVYWYRFKIRHTDSQRDWVIEFFDQTIDHIDFFYVDRHHQYTAVQMGDTLSFHQRPSWHKNFIVNLPLHPGQDITYYARVQSQQNADVLIVLRSRSWLFQYALDEYFFFGIFYGMILVFAFYNLLMFLAVRETYYLYYILYLASVGLYEMSADGIGFQYIWPYQPDFNYYASSLFLYLATTSAMIFSAALLNLRNESRLLTRVFVIVFAIRTALLILGLTVFPELIRLRFIEIIPFTAIYLVCLYQYFFRHYIPARFLVIAYTFVAFGILHKALQYLGIEWKPLGELSHYSLGFSFIIEMLLLSFAISDKIRLLRRAHAQAQEEKIEQLHENQKLKDELNERLEEQVRLKTAELVHKNDFIEKQNQQLEIANHQLAEQAREIAEINALLERDNVKLQHDVSEIKEARVLSKELTFDEFCSMQPGEDGWLKFLADLKWKNGYECRKCTCASYSSGRSPHSRRCTKCGYDESATAYTLLQNTHLPIQKALYMIFLVYNSQGSISSHKLSEILGIRQSTCWSYSSRIKTLMKERQKIEGKHIHDGWNSLILDDSHAVTVKK